MTTVKARIKQAYLSPKNIDSVYEQLVSEVSAYGLNVEKIYKNGFLKDHLKNMMKYLFSQSPTVAGDTFEERKERVIFLNALALKRVVQDVVIQNKKIVTQNAVGLTPFPITHIEHFKKVQEQQKLQQLQQQQQKVQQQQLLQVQQQIQQQRLYQQRLQQQKLQQQRLLQQQQQQQFTPPVQQFQFEQQISRHMPIIQPQVPGLIPLRQTNINPLNPMVPGIPVAPLIPANPYIMQKANLTLPGVTLPSNVSSSLSVPIDLLNKKKKKCAVKIEKLKTDKEHEYWSKRNESMQRDPEEDLHQETVQEIQSHQMQYNIQSMPFRSITITSSERNKELFPKSNFYQADVNLNSVVQLSLLEVDIPIKISVINDSNNKLYFAEDEDAMKTIIIPKDETDIDTLVTFLKSEMTRIGTNTYDVSINPFTKRVKIKEVQGKVFKLLFLQTPCNCASILGFDRIDYVTDNCYEANSAYNLEHPSLFVYLFIEELTDKPLVQLNVDKMKQKRKQQFTDYVLWCANTGPVDIDKLSIKFMDENFNKIDIGDENHSLTLKYSYFPVFSPPKTSTNFVPSAVDDISVEKYADDFVNVNGTNNKEDDDVYLKEVENSQGVQIQTQNNNTIKEKIIVSEQWTQQNTLTSHQKQEQSQLLQKTAQELPQSFQPLQTQYTPPPISSTGQPREHIQLPVPYPVQSDGQLDQQLRTTIPINRKKFAPIDL